MPERFASTRTAKGASLGNPRKSKLTHYRKFSTTGMQRFVATK